MLDPSNIQISWSHFKTTFLDIMEKCIPRAVLPNRKNLPWLNKEIIQLIRKSLRKPIIMEAKMIVSCSRNSETRLWQT